MVNVKWKSEVLMKPKNERICNVCRFASVLQAAKKAVCAKANTYTEVWRHCFPSQRLDEEISFHVLGRTPMLGFVIVNESQNMIKAFDEDMNFLKSWRIE